MSRSGTWLLGFLVAMIVAAPIPADDPCSDLLVVQDAYPFLNNCPDLPPDAEPVDFRILDQVRGMGVPGPIDEPIIWIEDRQVIDDQARYEAIFGSQTDDVNWDSERILVVEEYTSYYYGDVDGETVFDGVYRSGSTLLVRTTYTNYGPCQGIAMDMEALTFTTTNLLVVVPRDPEQICYSECRIGECPPDIP